MYFEIYSQSFNKTDMARYEYKFHFGFYAMKQLYQKKKSMWIVNDFSLTLQLWMEAVCLLG